MSDIDPHEWPFTPETCDRVAGAFDGFEGMAAALLRAAIALGAQPYELGQDMLRILYRSLGDDDYNRRRAILNGQPPSQK
jgi:hypothetical protein